MREYIFFNEIIYSQDVKINFYLAIIHFIYRKKKVFIYRIKVFLIRTSQTEK